MISIGPAKILIVLVVALIVLGPEKLPQMTRQIGKAWGDFRRFRENLEHEVRGALGDDLTDHITAPWSNVDGPASPTAPTQDGTSHDGGGQDRAPPAASGSPAPAPPRTGTTPSGPGGFDPGVPPDDPSLN